MLEIAVTFSGGGRTVLNLLDKIEAGALDARIVLAVTDRECKGIARIEGRGVPVERIPWTRETTVDDYASRVWPRIEASGARLVCFCGFLRLLRIPDAWENRVMNIHPALLPKFGGKGMWGDRVHRAVLEAGEAESGCTVHFANNEYDKGPILVQKRVPVLPGDTVETLAARVFEAECEAYPEAVRLFGAGPERSGGRKGEDPMSEFAAALAGLTGKKVRFFVGGGDRGFVQGPVKAVDGDRIIIEKEGEIRGTMHTISIRAGEVRYFEIDTLVK